jgi:hypothetical protein
VHVLVILYKSALPIDRVKQLFRERSQRYRDVIGLLQKLYVHDPSTGEVGGVYLFESKKDLDVFRSSDLENSIGRAYQFIEPPTIRAFEVVQTLHAQPTVGITAER